MRYIILFALLLCACNEVPPPPDPPKGDWDCSGHPDGFSEAFLKCVETMRGGYGADKPIQGMYTVPECEDYAHRLYCEPVTKKIQAAERKAKEDAASIKKLKKHRMVLCATLMGTCHELNYESKRDHDCKSACIIDDEDISKEVDAEMDAEKEE